jgi:hypothetical protein
MHTHLVRTSSLITLSFLLCAAVQAEPIKHRFLAVDESRSQLHYVDQFDSSKDWTIKFPSRYRDVQFLNDRVLVSTLDGYEEYDFNTQKKLKTVADAAYRTTETVVRLPNGHTILGCNSKQNDQPCIRAFELDENDAVMRTVTYAGLINLRLLRPATDGTLLFGSDKLVARGMWDGTVKTFPISTNKRHIYEVEELANGNYRVSCGYGVTLEEWTPNGEFVRTIADGKAADGLFCHFFGRAQRLENGHWVVSNWTGHGAQDSEKGPQLIEFDETGKVVWNWHDPKRAGSVHGVIVLN